MNDVREGILARLLAIVEAIDGVKTAARNRLDFNERELLAIGVLEGDEEPSSAVPDGRHRPARVPVPLVMVPEIAIIANEAMRDVGTVLNTMRVSVIDAVTGDATLLGLLRAEGAVAYRGLATEFGYGRAMAGRMFLRFHLAYVLEPNKL